ncbi:hypothetical protein LIER_04394 [Lithospermum erythrorhizon]|uniref:DUF569 domain-containing protein n=1 Tax=Lithospermum erythrorhizon TaxID=34254 RepID=A0AAV3P1E1_LITER
MMTRIPPVKCLRFINPTPHPIREGVSVKLKTRYGNYLRANGGLPPWKNSFTHDIPHRHRDWILWAVVETMPEPHKKMPIEEDVDLSDLVLTTTVDGDFGRSSTTVVGVVGRVDNIIEADSGIELFTILKQSFSKIVHTIKLSELLPYVY